MANENRRRRERGEATRFAIIEAAEMLFAQHGIDGASLRQIGVASGSANTNVVAYHFGDRDALVDAIIRYRLPEIERMRAALLAKREAQEGTPTLLELLLILFDPVIQQRNSVGQRSYAAFLAGLFRSGAAWQRYSFRGDYPTTGRILKLLHERTALPRALFRARMKICTNMVVSALDLLEREGAVSAETETFQFMDALVMAEAALMVQPPTQDCNQLP